MMSASRPFWHFLRAPGAWIPAGVCLAGFLWIITGGPNPWIIAGVVAVLVYILGVGLAWCARPRADDPAVLAAQALNEVPAVLWRGPDAVQRTWYSTNWQRRTGQVDRQALGEGWLAVLHPGDRDAYRDAARVATESAGPFEFEYRVRQADGRYSAVLDRAVPTFDRQGVWTGYMGIITDIDPVEAGEASPRVRVNPEVQERAVELIERVGEVEHAYERLGAIDRVRGEFLDALSLEMGETLEDLSDALVLLRNSDLSTTSRAYVERARERVTALFGFRGHITCLTGPGLEADEPPAPFDLRRVMDQVFTLHQPEAKKRHVAIEQNVDDLVPVRINGVSADFRAIAKDLWAAGLELTSKGKLSCVVSCENTPTESTDLLMTLTSTGGPVDESAFERAYYPREPVGNASPGLGLGHCKRLVERMGGRIGMNPTPDGAALWVTLPVEEVNPNAQGRRSAGRLPQQSVVSTLGPVQDVSMGGLRIECRRPYKGTMEIGIGDGEEEMRLNTEVVWTRKAGRGKVILGLRFIDLSPADAAALGRFAARNRIRQIMNAA